MTEASSAYPLIVTIDGPAASGKSSTAQMVAERLGVHHIDSGALYRAVTASRLRDGGDPELWTEHSVLDAARRVSLAPGQNVFIARIDGLEADAELRSMAVTAQVSRVASMSHVRAWVNEQVRDVAAEFPSVADGRDMGFAVFPDAPVKVWLVALPEVRALRRILQRNGGNPPSGIELAAETAELEARDLRDSLQTQPAPDAIWIDTSDLRQPEQVSRIEALVRKHLALEGVT
jgi:cytidylate kinase